MNKERWALYVHVPFCKHRCSYCDFFATADSSAKEMRRYTAYLTREIELFCEKINGETLPVSSVYIGGGTPSYAPDSTVTSLLQKIQRNFNLLPGTEITAEVNPESASRETLSLYRTAGVNRLSIGVQSFIPEELTTLERIHTARDAYKTVETAWSEGFDSISIDLMYGIPGQTLESWTTTLQESLTLCPEHISAYALMLEGNTKMAHDVRHGALSLPCDDLTAGMFEHAGSFLMRNGFEHYEVSNFALPGMRSRHNSHYWLRRPYRGFGLSAHSFAGNIRSWNTTHFRTYYRAIDNGVLPVESSEILTRVQRINEVLMLGLRTNSGLSMKQFERDFGREQAEFLRDKIEDLSGGKPEYLVFTDGTVRLTTRGMFVSDKVISRLMADTRDPEGAPPLPE